MRSLLHRARIATGASMTLGVVADRLAAAHGDRPLVEQPAGRDGRPAAVRLTHGQAADLVARMAGGLATGVAVGDRVVVAVPNGYELLLWCLAAARAGAIAVPVNDTLTADELDHVIDDAEPAVVVGRDEVPLGPPLPATGARPDDVAAIFYTSGTTGRPKGAELTHAGLLGGVRGAALWSPSFRRDEAVVGLPVAHIMGFSVLLGLAVAGIPAYVLPKFRPDEVLDAIEERRATVFAGVPAMYRMLLDAGAERRDLRSVRLWASGADVMPDELARRFQRMGASASLPVVGWTVGEAAFVEGYGMVETAGGVAGKLRPPLVPWSMGGAIGMPLPGNRLRVVVVPDDGDLGGARDARVGEIGELWVKGPGVLRGYRGSPDATAAAMTADGWLRTGDLVRRGPFGAVGFAGRVKHVVKRGGYSVYAVEVERALEEHESVAEAAVVGVPDVRDGEVPVAVVVLRPGAVGVDGEAIGRWVAGRLAPYKVPVRVEVVDSLPRTATEKVRRDEVRDRLLAAGEAPAGSGSG